MASGGDTGFALLDARTRRGVGEVSRPDALAQGPTEITLDGPGTASSARKGAATQLAAATPARRTTTVAGAADRVRAEPASPIVVANAEPAQVAPASATESRPFYQRVLGGMFGSSEPAAAPAPEPIVAAPVAATSSALPLPPRRRAVSAAPEKTAPAVTATPKPQASAGVRPERHAGILRSPTLTGIAPN